MYLKAFFKKHGVLLAVSFILGVLIPNTIAPSLRASVTSNPYSRAGQWEDAVVEYHIKANQITNEFLKVLTTEEEPDVSFPGEPEGCGRDNVSTYCLAVQLNDELHLLERDLILRRSEIQLENTILGDDEGGDEAAEPIFQIEEVIVANLTKTERIDNEIQSARDALELTLAVYNQAQLVYPIHREFEELIKNLEAYRDALAKLRTQIEGFPGKFNDATTPVCQ